jgi:hypothetical protein
LRISVYLPLLVSLLLAAATPLLVRYLAPPLATRTLAVTSALSAAASTWGLTLLGLTLLTAAPPAREHGGLINPVPAVVAVTAGVAVVWFVRRAVRAVGVRRRTHADLRAVCALCAPHGELAVVLDAAPHAYAVPGRPGRILISTGLLSRTDAAERAVVLAHERAHLRHHHHRYRAVTELAAALNPLLIPARTAVTYLVERWADETAATATGSRTHTARTLARLALTQPGPAAVLGFHRYAVTARVQALTAAPPRSVHLLAAATTLAATLSAAAASDATLAFARIVTPLLGG